MPISSRALGAPVDIDVAMSVRGRFRPRSTAAGTRSGRYAVIATVWLALLSGLLVALPAATASAASCTGNAVVCENQKAGNPASEWDITGAGDASIQGFSTQISVNAGEKIDFKIDSDAPAYTIKFYRLGWYQGNGARLIDTITPDAAKAHNQPACATDLATQIYDCGTWGVSASWDVPSDAVSGVYVARLQRSDDNGASHIVFVVRNDASRSKVLFQTSDTTWQAYNPYGGSNFYTGGDHGRAFKLSYNRPITTRGYVNGRDWVFANEYPMIRFMEQNGYDVSYASGIDTAINPNLLINADKSHKHDVFMTVGHDEYWSGPQRANVLAARDAGVNMAFMSGNDMYWKTRLEPSQDGNDTPNRTLVCYKDTWSNQNIDPVEPTPTWRDPRYGNLGFGPENELLGTLFKANAVDLAMKVSAEEGKLRLWRNTSLTSLAAGSTATLADHTIGYESNEDIDNGYRPAGLIRMSTTTGAAAEYLQDYGSTVAAGTTTHHLTQYRAASGALVFSAGTIQWAWGLDSHHDGEDVQPADPRMRQATANLLADMGALPATIASDLTSPTTSTDVTGPTVTVSTPSSGTSIAQGSRVTVKGTAVDTGGRVAGVEVSVDGGASFHPADGTTSWSYAGILTGNGAAGIQVRAMDDSSNTGNVVNVAVDSPCPCSIFGVITPLSADTDDDSAVTLGTKFTAAKNGYISAVRFYKSEANVGTHTGTLYAADGSVLATGTFENETASGWQTLTFPSVAVTANTTYIAAYTAPKGHYSADTRFFGRRDFNAGALKALGGNTVENGVYALGAAFPDRSYNQTNYYVDAVWTETDIQPVTVTATAPLSGASSISTSAAPTARFSKAVSDTSVVFNLVDADGNAVSATKSYDSATKTATLTPKQPLAPSTSYTATVNAEGMAAPAQFEFTTAEASSDPNLCPCTVFAESDHPSGGPDTDTTKVQLGMAFTAAKTGQVTGVRFYKNPENTGTHTVALWKDNTKLAEATVTNETTSGWQHATFAGPVSISKGVTYVASYTAPEGKYGFTAKGLTNVVTRGPLSSVAGGGRYTYSSTALTGTSNTNYYVDPVFSYSDDTPPTVAATSPGANATSVSVKASVRVTFSTEVQSGTAQLTVKNKTTGATVAGTLTSESQGAVATFVPNADLDPGTDYTISVSGAKSLGGAAMSGTTTRTFTTAGAGACPCSLMDTTTVPQQTDAGDGSAVTLGVKFKPSVDGFISGVRYYRDGDNTGTHTGALWSTAGDKLAEVTFNDDGTGWQTATFASKIAAKAGTTYIVSYYAPKGHYAADLHALDNPISNAPLSSVAPSSVYAVGDKFPNSSYANTNYYVDVIFVTDDTDPPSVSDIDPAKDSTATVDTTVSATFARAITASSLEFTLKTGSTTVSGQSSYDADSRTATFTPAADLAYGTTYTASVQATSKAGVAMAAPKTWSFTTGAQPPTGVAHSLYADTATPEVAAWDDSDPVEVGVRFSSTQAGQVTALKFYAGPGNTGGQKVTLWSPDGEALASGTAKGSGTGWRTVKLATPVAITAGTVYTVSYYAPTGHYSVTRGAYADGATNGPLSVPSGGATYKYPQGFPTAKANASYWVDVVVVTAS